MDQKNELIKLLEELYIQKHRYTEKEIRSKAFQIIKKNRNRAFFYFKILNITMYLSGHRCLQYPFAIHSKEQDYSKEENAFLKEMLNLEKYADENELLVDEKTWRMAQIFLKHPEISLFYRRFLAASLWLIIDLAKSAALKKAKEEKDALYPKRLLLEAYLRKNHLPFSQLRLELGQLDLCYALKFLDNKKEILKNILSFNCLVSLDVSENDLEEIPEEICLATNLLSLRLNRNLIQEIPSFLSSLEELQELYLLANQISYFPADRLFLPKLQIIDLGSNLLKSIPGEIKNFKNLRELTCDHNQIQAIPRELLEIATLNKLDLHSNRLFTFPDRVESSNLRSLDLSDNCIRKIPGYIARFDSLVSLDLSKNHLEEKSFEELSEFMKLHPIDEYFSSLQKLLLSSNQIARVPKFLKKVEKLKTLDLRFNKTVLYIDKVFETLVNRGVEVEIDKAA